MVTKERAIVDAPLEDLRVIRSPIVSPVTMRPRAGVAGMSGGERADTFSAIPTSPQTMSCTPSWAWTRCRHRGSMIIKRREGEKKLTASIHSADPARVPAPVPTADTSAPVPVPGHLVVAGTAALPHPSCTRTVRVDRGLVPWCLS